MTHTFWPNESFHHDPAITDFPPIDVSRGDGEDYVPYIDAEVEEPSTERPPSRCGRCEKNKTDDGKTDDDGPEGGPDDGAAGEVQPDDSLSFATDPPATENPVVNVSFQKYQNTLQWCMWMKPVQLGLNRWVIRDPRNIFGPWIPGPDINWPIKFLDEELICPPRCPLWFFDTVAGAEC